MAIVPIVRCRSVRASLAFYTGVLDFKLADDREPDDPGAARLRRAGDLLFLSSHAGDGELGQHVVVLCEDVDGLFEKFIGRGLIRPERDSPVHHGPVDQTWGTREVYVDDPDGNTIVFAEVR